MKDSCSMNRLDYTRFWILVNGGTRRQACPYLWAEMLLDVNWVQTSLTRFPIGSERAFATHSQIGKLHWNMRCSLPGTWTLTWLIGLWQCGLTISPWTTLIEVEKLS